MSTLDNPHSTVDPKGVSPWPTGSRYGLIAALVLIVLGLAVHLAGMVDYSNQNSAGNWVMNLVNWGVMIGAMVMAINHHRDKELGGYIKFGRAFTIGFIVSLIIAVISAIWTVVFFTMIEPDLINTILEASRDRMIEQQGMSEEQVEQSMPMVKMFVSPGAMAAFAGLGTLFFGLVFSLIVAAVLKKNPPEVV